MNRFFRLLTWLPEKAIDFTFFVIFGVFDLMAWVLDGFFGLLKKPGELATHLRNKAALTYYTVINYFKGEELVFRGKIAKPASPPCYDPYKELADWRTGNVITRDVPSIIADCIDYDENPKKYVKVRYDEYNKPLFMRAHRWRLDFGRETDRKQLLYAQNMKVLTRPSFFKRGEFEVEFYLKPEIVDYLATKPKTRMARIDLCDGSGAAISFIELDKVSFDRIDTSSLDFDYTSTNIMTVKAIFKYSRYRAFGSLTANGPIDKPLVI